LIGIDQTTPKRSPTDPSQPATLLTNADSQESTHQIVKELTPSGAAEHGGQIQVTCIT